MCILKWFQDNSALVQTGANILLVIITGYYVRLTKYLVYNQDEPYVLAELTFNAKEMPVKIIGKVHNYGLRPAISMFIELIYKDGKKQYKKIDYVLPEKEERTINIELECSEENIPQIVNLFYSYGIYVVKVKYDYVEKTTNPYRLKYIEKKWFEKKANEVFFIHQTI